MYLKEQHFIYMYVLLYKIHCFNWPILLNH